MNRSRFERVTAIQVGRLRLMRRIAVVYICMPVLFAAACSSGRSNEVVAPSTAPAPSTAATGSIGTHPPSTAPRPTASRDSAKPSATHPSQDTGGTTPRCQPDGLSGRVVVAEGAGGSEAFTVIIKNTGRNACFLDGYPGVGLVDTKGNSHDVPSLSTWGDAPVGA